jgi:hypothetical protein
VCGQGPEPGDIPMESVAALTGALAGYGGGAGGWTEWPGRRRDASMSQRPRHPKEDRAGKRKLRRRSVGGTRQSGVSGRAQVHSQGFLGSRGASPTRQSLGLARRGAHRAYFRP